MRHLSLVLTVLVLVGGLLATGCGNQPGGTTPLAFVEKIEKGEALVKRVNTPDFIKVDAKAALFPGDVIRTNGEGEAVLRFSTGAITRIMPKSEFELKEPKLEQAAVTTVFTRLVEGVAYFYVPKGQAGAKKFEVDTERAVASIKGTQFKVEAAKDTTTLTVSEGIVAFKDKVSGKETDVLAFQQAVAGPQGIVGPTQTNTLSDPNFGDGKIQMFETQGN